MEQLLDPKTREEFRNALDRLLVRADENNVLPDEPASFALTNHDSDTPNREVVIYRLRD